jgi:hypothetical protein
MPSWQPRCWPHLRYLGLAWQRRRHRSCGWLGIADLRVEWNNLHSGIAGTDGLLAGYLDINCGTTPSLLLIWDKTKGEVRSLAALSGLVSPLVTRNPDIYSIKDFGPTASPCPRCG